MIYDTLPGLKLRSSSPDIEQLDDFGIKALLVKIKRDFVNAFYIFCRDNLIDTNIAEESNFGLYII